MLTPAAISGTLDGAESYYAARGFRCWLSV